MMQGHLSTPKRHKPRPLAPPALTLLITLTTALSAIGGVAAAQTQPPAQAQPIMPLDEVRIGMTGYGLTVFQGTKIEAFPVEVVSIVPNFAPQRSTIWIRCSDPRLEVSGPVQGMSGSPIYLWNEGEAGELGDGGRLIGAFAFGFPLVEECLAGVQPIEYMREAGARAAGQKDDAAPVSAAQPGAGLAMLRGLQRHADQQGTPEATRSTLDWVCALLEHAGAAEAPQTRIAVSGPFDGQQHARPLMLPMAMGSDAVADALRPLLEPTGISPMVGGAGGTAPPGIDRDAPIEPGSVLAIPLVFGDLDLSAAGTTTDVLPDGTVLGFGHPMFGQGKSAVPMASGYVHFVVPRITISFKQAGSLRVVGSIVQDEAAAVAGVERIAYTTSPLAVTVALPDQEPRKYAYEVVDHPVLSAPLTAAAVAMSLEAVQMAPLKSTATISGEMVFTGGRTLHIERRLYGGSAANVIFEIVPVMTAMMLNPFEELRVERLDMSIDIREGLDISALETARLSRTVTKPGQTVTVTVEHRPYGEPVQTRQLQFDIPTDLPDGDYTMHVYDATMYMRHLMNTRPYLNQIDTIDDLFESLTLPMQIEHDALYVVLQLDQTDLAVGRTPLPRLPSSRAAVLARAGGSGVTQFPRMIERSYPLDAPIQGSARLQISVRSDDTPQP